METIPTHKKIPPSKNSERGAMLSASQDSPAFTSFFLLRDLPIKILIYHQFIAKAAAP